MHARHKGYLLPWRPKLHQLEDSFDGLPQWCGNDCKPAEGYVYNFVPAVYHFVGRAGASSPASPHHLRGSLISGGDGDGGGGLADLADGAAANRRCRCRRGDGGGGGVSLAAPVSRRGGGGGFSVASHHCRGGDTAAAAAAGRGGGGGSGGGSRSRRGGSFLEFLDREILVALGRT